MSWLPRWCRPSDPGNENRQALEAWIRLRFGLAASDPMIAIIGAFGRLTAAGMTDDDATETILRIMRESDQTGTNKHSDRRRGESDPA